MLPKRERAKRRPRYSGGQGARAGSWLQGSAYRYRPRGARRLQLDLPGGSQPNDELVTAVANTTSIHSRVRARTQRIEPLISRRSNRHPHRGSHLVSQLPLDR
jgi:hypothetical protein